MFDCQLSPWGVEGCDDEDILAVGCYQDAEPDNFQLEMVKDDSHKITEALTSLLGLGEPNRKTAKHMIPIMKFDNFKFGFCLSKNFYSLEATHLCQNQGFECGVPNFDNIITTQNIEKESKYQKYLPGLFY